MNSIKSWNIFCQNMLASIDGEKEYKEFDFQFEKFLNVYHSKQRRFLEKSPCLTMYKLASGYEENEFYGLFLDEIEKIESLGFISAKIELIISLYWNLYNKEDEEDEYGVLQLDQSLQDNLNCSFEDFFKKIKSMLEDGNVDLAKKYKIIQMIKSIDDSLINSSSYIITYPNNEKRVYKVDDKIDSSLELFIYNVLSNLKKSKHITEISIYLENLKDIYFEKYVSLQGLDENEFLMWLDYCLDNKKDIALMDKTNKYVHFISSYLCF